METLVPIFSQYGIVGAVLACCGWYVYKHDQACNTAHKDAANLYASERIEWLKIVANQHTEALEVTKDMTKALVDNSRILADLSTLIRDRQ